MGKITINSSVKRAYAPDIVNFNIHICKVDSDSASLTRYNKEIIDSLIKGIDDLSIDEDSLREVYFRIGVNREYKDGSYIDNGYKLDTRYVLTSYIDYELMDSIRDMLSELGVEYQIEYALEDESKMRDALLAEAVAKSRDKAKIIANAGGMQIGDMKDVRYGDNNNGPMLLRASAKRDTLAEDIEISESVEVEWEIKAL